MVDYLSSFSKNIVHQTIEQTFPLTDEIALISAGAGWYAYRYGMTYTQGFMAETSSKQFGQWLLGTPLEAYGSSIGHIFAPIYVPTVSPEVSNYMGLGAYLVTCFTLNLFARFFFSIKAKQNQPNLLPAALQKIGIDITPIPPAAPSENEKIETASLEEEIITSKIPLVETPPLTESLYGAMDLANSPLGTKENVSEKEPNGIIKVDDNIIESDIFDDDDPLGRGCCFPWKICFS
jgi:hypothetical protein